MITLEVSGLSCLKGELQEPCQHLCMPITLHPTSLRQSAIGETLLRALPAWFGMESATAQYIRDIEELSTLLAWEGDTSVGFLALHHHHPVSAEVHRIGVLPEYLGAWSDRPFYHSGAML